MDLALTGKVAFVAGASRGLGRAIAESLAAEGCNVAVTARGGDVLSRTAEEIRREHARDGARVVDIPVDLTDPVAAEGALGRTRHELGEIDILVCNVGGSRGEKTSAASDEEWEEVLDLNFRVAVRLCRAVIPAMKERRTGAILTVSSIYGREWGGPVSYNAAKAALIAMTKSLSRELIPFGIRVNSLAPGSILFEGGSWDRRRKADPEGIDRFIEAELPRGSFGRAAEIGDVAAFLCSERASLVAGACLNVDGGQSRSLF
jgi:3-oxoacyl-[acyl-carrier protein] reductase